MPAPSVVLLGTDAGSADQYVKLNVTPTAWIVLIVTILVLLGIDLYRHREAHVPTTREALLESTAWVACGLGFSIVILAVYGPGAFGEYLSGYLTEKALSIDNVFVWSILFTSLAIPVALQHRVLFWGIFGALAMRAIFIFVGAALLEQFEILLVFFGLFLVYTGVRMIRHREDEGDEESLAGLKLLERFMPVSPDLDGQKFFTRINGKRAATPLLAALVVIEVTDLVFAIDSVPAILALSKEEFLIFSSNAFAILGLRAMYFLLADARQRFHYLNHALGAILVFVGLKMALSRWFHLNVWVSLGIIALLLLGAVVFSELKNRQIAADAAAARET
jgi:tellurite resistance protein TerC